LTVFIVYSFGSVAFNVGEILPRGGFVIYEIWEVILVSRGDISAG